MTRRIDADAALSVGQSKEAAAVTRLPTQAALQASQGQRLLVWQQLGHDLCLAPHNWTGSTVETREKRKFEPSYHLKEGTLLP